MNPRIGASDILRSTNWCMISSLAQCNNAVWIIGSTLRGTNTEKEQSWWVIETVAHESPDTWIRSIERSKQQIRINGSIDRSFQEPMSPCVRCNVVMSQWANGPQTLHQRIKQAMYHGHINSINQKRWLVASRSHGDKWPTVCSWVTAKWLVRLGDLNQNRQSSASINPWTSQT